MKKKHQTLGEQLALLITVKREQPVVQLQNVINCEEFNNYQKLLRVTAYVLRFCKNIRSKKLQVKVDSSDNFLVAELSVREISEAELLWVISVQSVMKGDSKYQHLVFSLMKGELSIAEVGCRNPCCHMKPSHLCYYQETITLQG